VVPFLRLRMQVPRTGKRSLSATSEPLSECRMGKHKYEYETIQECLRYAKDAAREVSQKLVITSFDLGACMKAYL